MSKPTRVELPVQAAGQTLAVVAVALLRSARAVMAVEIPLMLLLVEQEPLRWLIVGLVAVEGHLGLPRAVQQVRVGQVFA